MARKITCPGCETTYTLSDGVTARKLTCKHCGAPIDVATARVTPPPVAVRPEVDHVRRPRSDGRHSSHPRFAARPFYLQPAFYVGIAATIVCGYFAVKFH